MPNALGAWGVEQGVGLFWPACPCSQALAYCLQSSRPLGFGCPISAPMQEGAVGLAVAEVAEDETDR